MDSMIATCQVEQSQLSLDFGDDSLMISNQHAQPCLTVSDINEMYGTDFDSPDAESSVVIQASNMDTLTIGPLTWPSSCTVDTLQLDTIEPYLSTIGAGLDNGVNVTSNGRISLCGDKADLEINGESVVGMLREIRDRLNILQVSEIMEQEWDELRDLRERYEAKLCECREKSEAWSVLKKMPPPKID